MDGSLTTETVAILGTVVATGLALAGLIMRSIARTDRRTDHFEDAMGEFRRSMDSHRALSSIGPIFRSLPVWPRSCG